LTYSLNQIAAIQKRALNII